MKKNVLVVGGGFTGLTAAYRLARSKDFSVTLVEGSDHLGGLAAGFPLLGTSLEKTYHHLFLTDQSIRDLATELGLQDKLVWRDSSVGIYRDGRIYPFMSPLDLLRFKPCGFASRVRLGLVALYLKHTTNWRKFAARRASEWMSKACGRDGMEAVWLPLLKGKFDRYYDSVSMAWLWGRIHIRANSRTRGDKEKLGYFRGGFEVVVRALEAELRKRDVSIQTKATVEIISPQQRTAVVNGKTIAFDFCVFTGPSYTLAKLLPAGGPHEDYSKRLRAIDYLGAICMIFTSDQCLGDIYWTNVNEPGAPFLVFINHTRLVGTDDYQGRHVYYIGAYLPVDGRIFSLSDEELTKLWGDYLKKMFPEFNPARVEERHIFRFKAAQHVVDTDYEQKVPAFRTPLPGLFLANFSQLFPEDRGTNFSVRDGNKVAEMVRAEAQSSA
ncbi:MAG TPA: NAD(P)/FAD-dependent oxidoreductase [Verrucomicrobiae bacterium]|jgi:protoporphyrinogen oxidase|nr:NAD(P)/FAD-dependent oxidoreductase [Verrucomicrobiae bacterium]